MEYPWLQMEPGLKIPGQIGFWFLLMTILLCVHFKNLNGHRLFFLNGQEKAIHFFCCLQYHLENQVHGRAHLFKDLGETDIFL